MHRTHVCIKFMMQIIFNKYDISEPKTINFELMYDIDF